MRSQILSSPAYRFEANAMWIVQRALRRLCTFVALALRILILGVLAIRTTATDIFPKINIPVVSIVWQYQGLAPPQMET